MKRRAFSRMALTAGLVLAGCGAAYGQQTIAPHIVHRGALQRETSWLALLRAANNEGSQEHLLAVITEFLADLAKAGVKECCDQRRHVFQVTFLASEATNAPLVRILVHRNGLSRATIPGIRGTQQALYEVFVAEDLGVALQSVYLSEPLEDPLAKESGEFVRLVFGKLALPVGSNLVLGRVNTAISTMSVDVAKRVRESKPPLAVTLSRIVLPDNRAKITISHTLSVNDPAGHVRAQGAFIADSVTRESIVRKALELSTEADPACAGIATAMQKVVESETGGVSCLPLAADPAECFKAVKEAAAAAYLAAAKQNAACNAAAAFPLARRFMSVVPEKVVLPSKGTTTLSNTPETHWTFGLSTGFIGGLRTDSEKPRAKINGGKIVVDPFSRLLAMGIVSWTPAGYEPGPVSIASRERLKLFTGVAFAPGFGGTGGVSWAFTRYLGANVGYAYLVYDTPKSGEQLDIEPSAANKAAPFKLAGTHGWFIGLTYNVAK